MLISLYFYGKKENGTWGKDVQSNINNDPTDLVAVIEELINNNEEETNSAVGGFNGGENDDWEIILMDVCLFVIFLERYVWNEEEKEMNISL